MTNRRQLPCAVKTTAAGLALAFAVWLPGCGGANASIADTHSATAPGTIAESARNQPASAAHTQPAGNPLVWEGANSPKLVTLPEGGPSTLWQMLAAVVVILVLGGVALIVVRKLLPRIAPRGGKRMTVLETIYLEPRKALHLVRVGDQKFLLAASREGLSVLAEVSSAVTDEPEGSQQAQGRR